MTRVGSQRHKKMRNLNIQDERTNCTYLTILLLHSVEWQTKIYTQQLTGMGAQPIFQLGNSQKKYRKRFSLSQRIQCEKNFHTGYETCQWRLSLKW